MSKEAVSLGQVECVHSTTNAIRVIGIDGEGPTWIPQSCVHDDSEVWRKGQRGDLKVEEWYAEDRGWL